MNMMRNALLELVDHYDAVAAELRRKNIPVKNSWEAHQAFARTRLDRLVSLHEQANNEELSLELGESKFSAEQIRRLHTEVNSLAALLFIDMEALITDIAAMDAAAARETASCRDIPLIPVLPLLHPGSAATSAHSAESATAWAARQCR